VAFGSRLWETVSMADPRDLLEIETYVYGIPASAVCRRCKVKFLVDQSPAVTPQKAIERFYAEFDTHKCNPKQDDASKAA
jgi:hypothetical protein